MNEAQLNDDPAPADSTPHDQSVGPQAEQTPAPFSKPKSPLAHHDYFDTLRQEIKATKNRAFIVILLGIVGSPLLAYLVGTSHSIAVIAIAPILPLLLLVLYVSEQTMLMRAAKYIRDHIETEGKQWEHWVVANRQRAAEGQLFAMFTVASFAFFVLLSVVAVNRFLGRQTVELAGADTISFGFKFWQLGMPILYSLTTVWVLVTLFRFWRAAVNTRA